MKIGTENAIYLSEVEHYVPGNESSFHGNRKQMVDSLVV